MELKQLLQNTFGFSGFKTGQQQIIEKTLTNKSATAIFPTGSGKSLCYQLPATQLPGYPFENFIINEMYKNAVNNAKEPNPHIS